MAKRFSGRDWIIGGLLVLAVVLSAYFVIIRAIGPQPPPHDLSAFKYSVEPGAEPAVKLQIGVADDGQGISNIDIARTGTEVLSGRNDSAAINVLFTAEGAQKLADLTTLNVGKELFIKLDGQEIVSLKIKDPIVEGRCQISGGFTPDEADSLARGLVGQASN